MGLRERESHHSIAVVYSLAAMRQRSKQSNVMSGIGSSRINSLSAPVMQ